MKEYTKANFDDLLADAKGNKEKAGYLTLIVTETPSQFLTVRKKYYSKYYKELMPVATHKKTMLDKVKEL